MVQMHRKVGVHMNEILIIHTPTIFGYTYRSCSKYRIQSFENTPQYNYGDNNATCKLIYNWVFSRPSSSFPSSFSMHDLKWVKSEIIYFIIYCIRWNVELRVCICVCMWCLLCSVVSFQIDLSTQYDKSYWIFNLKMDCENDTNIKNWKAFFNWLCWQISSILHLQLIFFHLSLSSWMLDFFIRFWFWFSSVCTL